MSDTCPTVRPGDRISFDWNPGFEHAGMVTGLASFALNFGRLADDGVAVKHVTALRLAGLGSRLQASNAGNGYFHVELTIPAHVAPGEYHLIGAMSMAKMLPAFEGPSPTMTNSPVSARFCLTVLPHRRVPALEASTP